MPMDVSLENPDSLSTAEYEEISRLIFHAFSDNPLMPHEVTDWSPEGILNTRLDFLRRATILRTLWLAKVPSQTGSDILGFLVVRIPRPPGWIEGQSLPGGSSNADSTTSAPAAPVPREEHVVLSEDAQRRVKWRNEVLDPWQEDFAEQAFGKPRAPALHIVFLAVSPKSQGLGIGKKLMNKAFEIAGEHNIGCTLMTKSRRTMEWYTSLGFDVAREDQIEVNGNMVTFWAMRRAPVSS